MKASSIVTLAIVLFFGQACAADYPPPEPVTSLSPAVDRLEAMRAKIQQLRKDRDTGGLEALANELRQSKESLDGGTWLLTHFYDNAVRIPREEPAATEAMEFYESWAQNSPQSITAQVCLADALVSYAWSARGGGYANTVTSEGWRLMGERLDRAWQVLENAGKLDEQCPGWFEVAQTVALGQNWERSDYFDMVDEAIKREPTYGGYYTKVCYWLLPRWHGEPGDFEEWIAVQADSYPEDQRDRQYARFVWMADMMPVGGELVFRPGRLDWPRTKRGFEAWLANDPDNLNVRFEYTRLALLANDRETARAQFDITGGKYYPPSWRDEGEFEQARRFAYEGTPNPLTQKKKTASGRPSIPSETLATVEKVLNVLTGLIGGALAGLFLLWLAIQRRHIAAGFVALGASVLLGALFGTLSSLIPAGLLYLHLKRKSLVHPPQLAPTRGWVVLLAVIGLAGFLLAVQVGSAVFAFMPYLLKNGPGQLDEANLALVRNGVSLRHSVSAAWLTLLALLVICGPMSREGWIEKFGLRGFRGGAPWGWTALAGALLAGWAFVADPLMDARTKEAIELIAEGAHSPFWYLVALVVAMPLLEELLFRGYAFSGWIDKIGLWGAIGIPALIFTACHFHYGVTGLLTVLIMGLLLGILRWKTGSIYPCIGLHAANNLAMAVTMILAAGEG
ncbi:MAG: CPBP family intramembrane metalloprotease [Chthoniobacterales bacterium]|nr:CPBP family intramembrane metalloprotease [Chthoniobacterales bacterium]